MSEARIRMIVVDDSALFRLMIRDVLKEIPGASVIGNAENGRRAVELIRERRPDLVTLDVEMPDMNGIEVLRELRRTGDSTPAIMVSRLTANGAQITTDALLEGAFDFVLKPSGGDPVANKLELKRVLAEKLSAFQLSRTTPRDEQTAVADDTAADSSKNKKSIEVLLIGASTGGPDALRAVLPKLPADFPVPVLVVQHMPPQYTNRLAARLNEICPLAVHEATDRMLVQPGNIIIAPGGTHMKVVRQNQLVSVRLTDDPPEQSCRPAVDYLFRSAAEVWEGNTLSVILTGMGHDGTEGCRVLRDRGGFVIAQSAEGCVVYGMPKSVIENSLADRALPLSAIGNVIKRMIS